MTFKANFDSYNYFSVSVYTIYEFSYVIFEQTCINLTFFFLKAHS